MYEEEEIFRLLFGAKEEYLHIREIERRSGLTVSSVREESLKLVGLGVVVRRKDGNRTYYEPNKKHPLYPEIRRLVLKTCGLTDVLKAALSEPGVRYAFVFGSVAAGNEKPESDIDLMVIGDVGLRKVSAMLSGVSEALGREINPHTMSAEEFARRRRQKEHFVSSVMEAPKLFVVGEEHELSAMGKQRLAQDSQDQC